MKICQNCGAHLDAGERCDCAEDMKAVLAAPETVNVVEIVKALPRDAQIRVLGIIEGAALMADIKAAG